MNLLRVAGYRFGLKTRLHPARRARATIPSGPFFPAAEYDDCPGTAPAAWRTGAMLFGHYPLAVSNAPPDWHADPWNENVTPPASLPPWWAIPDFGVGDIKNVWELNRLDWALAFAQQARCGQTNALDRLNGWLEDWSRANPPYLGRNWKCAQEASIRLIHLSLASLFLGQEARISPALSSFVDAHVRRILPTLSYARAQDNNHATSEAAALFIAGAWLLLNDQPAALRLAQRGRELLESSVSRLFAADGTFSQYSINYHRLALDTLSVAELWRKRGGLAPFSKAFQERAAAASAWLRTMVDERTGDAPNIGANDGANLLPLTDADLRDFRLSVQIASAFFENARAYPAGPWDEGLHWLDTDPPQKLLPPPGSANFPDGGFAVLQANGAKAVLRYPRFRFRPSQADALHLDFWIDGRNILRDGGSYRYNAEPAQRDYFTGVQSHNTVEFDGLPQMPPVSRFLLGDWLETETLEFSASRVTASYRSRAGSFHRREVNLGTRLEIVDEVAGFESRAVLRWRLPPGRWVIENGVALCDDLSLSISANVPLSGLIIRTGSESRYYGAITPLPVVEATIDRPGVIRTALSWAS